MTAADAIATEVATRKARALAITCPFCGATAGQPCRARESGREKDWPHSTRITAAEPTPQREATRVDALCCVCGHSRKVSVDYYRPSDRNHADGAEGKQGGWRKTQTLKCDACRASTRHAILAKADGETYWDERRQRAALGDDQALQWDTKYLVKWRQEYREMPFPRNPKLHHLRYGADVDKAIAAGNTRITALCGEPIDISPSETTRGKDITEPTAPREITDTEFEDPTTGLWWLDMDCVDCLRVSNRLVTEWQRRRLEHLLLKLSVHPEKIADDEVSAVLEYLDRFNGNQTTP